MKKRVFVTFALLLCAVIALCITASADFGDFSGSSDYDFSYDYDDDWSSGGSDSYYDSGSSYYDDDDGRIVSFLDDSWTVIILGTLIVFALAFGKAGKRGLCHAFKCSENTRRHQRQCSSNLPFRY